MIDGDKITGTVLLCADLTDENPLLFADNVVTSCFFCKCALQHRPHAPQPNTPMCWRCWHARMTPDDQMVVTAETIRETLLWEAPASKH